MQDTCLGDTDHMFTSARQAIASPLFSTSTPAAELSLARSAGDAGNVIARTLGLPFDLMRAQYACAVQAGFVERSLLAGFRFERDLGLLERLVLGPWARHV